MGKVVLGKNISLDGFAEDSKGSALTTRWTCPSAGTREYRGHVQQLIIASSERWDKPFLDFLYVHDIKKYDCKKQPRTAT